MAETFRDDFVNSDGTTLQAHDANWTKSWSATADGSIASNRARGAGSAANIGYYYNGFTPGSADYLVGSVLRCHSIVNNTGIGVVARSSVAASPNQYWARGVAVTAGSLFRVQLLKCVAGTFTQLGGNSDSSFSAGADKTLELDVNGSTITAYLDSVSVISVSDSSVTSAGVIGLRSVQSGAMSDTTSIHAGDIYVEEASGTTYNDSVTESVTATDAITNTLGAAGSVTESVTATDSASSTLAAVGSLTESVTATEAIGSTAVLSASVSESVTATDSPSAGGASSYSQNVLESVHAADTISATGGWPVTPVGEYIKWPTPLEEIDRAPERISEHDLRRTFQRRAWEHAHVLNILLQPPPVLVMGLSANQSISLATQTKVAFNAIHVDNYGWWDPTNLRFTPQTRYPARWRVSFNILYVATAGNLSSSVGYAYVIKSGNVDTRRYGPFPGNGADVNALSLNGSCILELDGIDDYVELYGLVQNGTPTVAIRGRDSSPAVEYTALEIEFIGWKDRYLDQ